jgi:hypothetical protein
MQQMDDIFWAGKGGDFQLRNEWLTSWRHRALLHSYVVKRTTSGPPYGLARDQRVS